MIKHTIISYYEWLVASFSINSVLEHALTPILLDGWPLPHLREEVWRFSKSSVQSNSTCRKTEHYKIMSSTLWQKSKWESSSTITHRSHSEYELSYHSRWRNGLFSTLNIMSTSLQFLLMRCPTYTLVWLATDWILTPLSATSLNERGVNLLRRSRQPRRYPRCIGCKLYLQSKVYLMDVQCMLVKKASWKWRMCVDYTDLNRACPKDSYPFSNIDKLV